MNSGRNGRAVAGPVGGWIWLALLLGFAAYTAWVAVGPVRLYEYLSALALRSWGAQILIDLALMAAIALGWLIGDARRLGWGVWRCVGLVAATVLLGSIAPLLYLAWRGRRLAHR